MNKSYSPPELVTYGDLTQVTGVFGVSGANDSFIDDSGNEISPPEGTEDPGAPGGSIDGCARNDQGECIADV